MVKPGVARDSDGQRTERAAIHEQEGVGAEVLDDIDVTGALALIRSAHRYVLWTNAEVGRLAGPLEYSAASALQSVAALSGGTVDDVHLGTAGELSDSA